MGSEIDDALCGPVYVLSFILVLIFVALIILGIMFHLEIWDEYSDAALDVASVLFGSGLAVS
ncbi:MAG: hypothetical protein ACD_5C00268G0011, partial [uncultured bacterium]